MTPLGDGDRDGSASLSFRDAKKRERPQQQQQQLDDASRLTICSSEAVDRLLIILSRHFFHLSD